MDEKHEYIFCRNKPELGGDVKMACEKKTEDFGSLCRKKEAIYRKINIATWRNELNVLKRLVEIEQAQRHSQKTMKSHRSLDFGPLHYACSLGNVDILSYLLEANVCDKNARDKDGNTPLMWLMRSNFDEVRMELLLDALVDQGAALNAQNYAGETALFIAAACGSVQKVKFLMENGAWTQISNLEGATPLHAAAAAGFSEVIKILLRFGAFVNAIDDEGDSALHWAVREGKADAVKTLMCFGADVSLKNEDEESAFDLALCFKQSEVLEVFARSTRKVPSLFGRDFDLRRSSDDVDIRAAEFAKMEVEMKTLTVSSECEKIASIVGDLKSGGVQSIFGRTPPSISFSV